MTADLPPTVLTTDDQTLRIAALREAYERGTLTPEHVVAEIARRIARRGDDGVWISLDLDAAHAAAADLGSEPDPTRSLWGIPFAVKDNIDVEGWETTAACPAFAYVADRSATAVDRLRAEGAILIGKTNLDQFATGLNGTRSPYGIPRSVVDPAMISGGSSSGSAVAVAAGLVAFSLGTDTAGSGRVPAALNGIVGYKPSRGRVSTAGVVPACRSLDCVSVFAHTVDDAALVVDVMALVDPHDPWSRAFGHEKQTPHPGALRLAIPASETPDRTHGYDAAWRAVLTALHDDGVELVEVDVAGLLEAGRLLYQGPWLAERLEATEAFLARSPDEVHPVVRGILEGGAAVSGVEAFAGIHRLQELRRDAVDLLASVDALLMPTVLTTFTVDEMLADPVARNAALGRLTTFGNLLDLAALAVPTRFGRPARPFGVSVIVDAGADHAAAAIAAALERVIGSTPLSAATVAEAPADVAPPPERALPIAVVGAHLAGMPLHGDLLALGARAGRAATTAPEYRLVALDTTPPKPGLIRIGPGGAPISVEIYDLPLDGVGALLASIPEPLGLGTIRLDDGSHVHGFVCEAIAADGAPDISAFGGWRAYSTA